MKTSGNRADSLTPGEARWAVGQAALAPSVHNSQPWRFRWNGAEFELSADTRLALTATDPDGRELAISCGAALFNLRMGLRKLGRNSRCTLVPDERNPRLLARVEVLPDGQPADPEERLLCLATQERHTYRGGFDNRAVPNELSAQFQRAAEEEGAHLLYVTAPGSRERVLHLSRAAERAQRGNERVRDEILDWTPLPGTHRLDGIPAAAYAPGGPNVDLDDLAARDFDLGREIGGIEPHDGPASTIAVLATDTDLLDDWLRAGIALEHVLVLATRHGVRTALHSQLVEVPNLRQELRRELPTDGCPQLLMRFGYGVAPVASPRRPAELVIELDDA